MPFYSAETRNNHNRATLQVQCPYSFLYHLGKRVLFFTSHQKRGSLTIEAALSLSIFVFAVVCLMLPMRMMDTQRKIQAVLEESGENLSRLSYITWKKSQQENEKSRDEASWNTGYGDYLAAAAVNTYLTARIYQAAGKNTIKDCFITKSQLMEDGEHIVLQVSYKMKLPFSVFGLSGLSMTSGCFKRAWIGKEGGKKGGSNGEDADDTMVYVGKSMGRYHLSPACHYLDNQLTAVSFKQVGDYRNTGGGKYKPCAVCGSLVGAGGTVYLMPSADRYHSQKSCSAIIAFVRAVPLSQVEHLGVCSYCNRKK